MELIVISESKLKITLTPPDMVKYELEGHTDTVDPHTRRAFRHLLRDAGAEGGFLREGAPLFIQLYASKGGGCEIFVTCLEGGDGFPDGRRENVPHPPSPSRDPSRGEERLLRRIREAAAVEAPSLSSSIRVFRFTHLPHLLALCRRLSQAPYRGRSAVYIEDSPTGDSRWYLELEFSPESIRLLPLVTEFTPEISADPLYLAEHGRQIISQEAVETLGEMA